MMLDMLGLSGLLGTSSVDIGMGAQQASADYFRRNQEAMLQAVGDGRADATTTMQAALNAWHPPKSQFVTPYYDVEALAGPDWLYWGWVAVLAALELIRFGLGRP